MDKVPTYAVWTLIAVMTVVIAIDIALLKIGKHNDGERATYSEVIAYSARKWPIMYVLWALFWGILFGHWFWPVIKECSERAA